MYVGQDLPSAIGTIEPALINPALPLGSDGSDRSGHDLGPSPSYHLISPDSRAGYLAWLAGDRDRRDGPAGFVSLFFAGLERRVLVDAPADPAVRRELPAIAAEVRRLTAARRPVNDSFSSCATSFLEVLELLRAPRWMQGGDPPSGVPPALRADRWPVPMALRVALAGFALTGAPVPADWARSWAWYHPSLFPATPQTRCPEEFEQLFAVRYSRRFAGGLVLSAAARPPVRIGYSPASPGIDAVVMNRPDLPDVLEEPMVTRELGALVDSVTDALTPYSRWLARTPGGHGSLASTALLPADLLELRPGPMGALLDWANAHLDGKFAAVIEASEFSVFWSTSNPAAMSRDEATSLALILARAGLGVEPDVRFGGPALAPGPAVLFRLDRAAPDHPSPGYLAAAMMLHLAASVALAAWPEPEDNANAIITGLAAEVPLSVAERSRLAARLRWLLASGAALRAPGRRISALTAAEREAAGHFLAGVATAGPVLTPETVTALTKAYRVIGLSSDLAYRRLHQRSAGPGGATPGLDLEPTDGPVVVRRPRASSPGHPLPRAPSASRVQPSEEVQLSQEVISSKMIETAAVSTLLASIFTDDSPPETPTPPTPPSPPDFAGVEAGPDRQSGGLDQAHSRLLGELTARRSWSRAEFAELARKYGVMPSGAMDVINEVAIETAGEPVVEGDDELTVNEDAVRELLA